MSIVAKSIHILHRLHFELLSTRLIGVQIKSIPKGLQIVVELLQTLKPLIPPELNL